MKNRSLHGMVMVVLAAILWGTTGTAQSFAPPQLSSYWVGALRLVVAATFFWSLLWMQGRSAIRISAIYHLPWLGIGVAAVCMCVYNLTFFAGVRDTGVAVGTALALGSSPVWAGLLQVVIHRTLPKPRWWLGTVIAVSGVVTMVVSKEGGTPVALSGVWLCLLAGLSYASYTIVNERMVCNASPFMVTTTVFTLAALFAAPSVIGVFGWPQLTLTDTTVVLWLGVVSTGIAYLLFSHALRRISAATAVVLTLAEPLTAFILAIVVVGEPSGVREVIGLVGLLIGLGLVVQSEMRLDK